MNIHDNTRRSPEDRAAWHSERASYHADHRIGWKRLVVGLIHALLAIEARLEVLAERNN